MNHKIWTAVAVILVLLGEGVGATTTQATTTSTFKGVEKQGEDEDPAERMLTLSQALDLAMRQNLQLESARAMVRAVETLTRQVRSQWLPRVIVYGVYMHLDHDTVADLTSSFEPFFAYFASLGPVLENLGMPPMPSLEFEPVIIQHQEDYRAGGSVSVQFQPRSIVQYESAELARRQGEQRVDSAGLQLAKGVTELYYGLVTIHEMRDVTLRNLETRRLSLENAQARYDVGMTTELDVLRARLALSEAERQLAQLDANYEDLRNQAAMLLQTEPDFEVTRPPAAPTFDSPEEVWSQAQLHHPDLLAAQTAWELAENAYDEVTWTWAPVFDASFNLNAARETAFSDENVRWDITLKLAWPLFLGGVRLAQMEQRAAEESAADYQVRHVRAELMSRIERAFIQRSQLHSDMRLAQDQLRLAEEALAIARVVYDQGVATQLELMQAETMLFAVQTRTVQTELAIARQNAVIYSMTGRIWHP